MPPGSLDGLYVLVLVVIASGVCIVPSGSLARRPTVPALALSVSPAVVNPIAAWPCPVTMTEGMKKYFDVESLLTEEVNTVPAWTMVGEPEPTGTLNWYQREPTRVALR